MLELFEHNQKAYESAVNMMNTSGKAAIIHPTGTGKSLIAFKLAEDNPDASVYWLSPSQYIYHTQLENLQITPTNIHFISYSKLMHNEGIIEEIEPDYIVLDEFHRCGAREWGKSVKNLIERHPDAKLLGLSATNIRYLDNQRDMASELFDGYIASEMTLGEAMAREILSTPKYVMAMYDYDKELKKIEQRIRSVEDQELMEQLRRSLEQADGMPQIFKKHMKTSEQQYGKYIVFCSDIAHMDDMADKSQEWFKDVDTEPHIYKAYYSNPKTSKAFAEFKEDKSRHLKLLYCIDMLNEGVHVNDIDGVILLRPTVSPIIYMQQIGRCLSAGKNAQPIIFDLVDNFESLHGIDYLNEEIEQAFDYMHSTYEKRAGFKERFKIYDEVRASRKMFERLQANLSSTWDNYYAAARAYYEQNGNLRVKKDYVTDKGLTLGNWIQTQRKVYSGKMGYELSAEKIEKLNNIGMIWSARANSFEAAFRELEKYYLENGNLDIKARYVSPTGYPLGKWINNTRVKVNKKGIDQVFTKEQQKSLAEMGMIWKRNEEVWDVYIEAAKEYKQQYGNLRVPVKYETIDGIQLGKWMANIRNKKKNPTTSGVLLDESRIHQMESLGIVW